MDSLLNEWNRIFINCGPRKPLYDEWLDKYEQLFRSTKQTPIIDLGCGFGNDTLYLWERGYKVISCDYASEALKRLKYFIPNPDVRLFNMLDGLPFRGNSARIIISDLSLNYFLWSETCQIVAEISRVLKNKGYLFCRVNSVNDINYGAGVGKLIEENYYENNGKYKRFYDRRSLESLFQGWEIVYLKEIEMNRYGLPKVVWEIAVRNNKVDRQSYLTLI